MSSIYVLHRSAMLAQGSFAFEFASELSEVLIPQDELRRVSDYAQRSQHEVNAGVGSSRRRQAVRAVRWVQNHLKLDEDGLGQGEAGGRTYQLRAGSLVAAVEEASEKSDGITSIVVCYGSRQDIDPEMLGELADSVEIVILRSPATWSGLLEVSSETCPYGREDEALDMAAEASRRAFGLRPAKLGLYCPDDGRGYGNLVTDDISVQVPAYSYSDAVKLMLVRYLFDDEIRVVKLGIMPGDNLLNAYNYIVGKIENIQRQYLNRRNWLLNGVAALDRFDLEQFITAPELLADQFGYIIYVGAENLTYDEALALIHQGLGVVPKVILLYRQRTDGKELPIQELNRELDERDECATLELM